MGCTVGSLHRSPGATLQGLNDKLGALLQRERGGHRCICALLCEPQTNRTSYNPITGQSKRGSEVVGLVEGPMGCGDQCGGQP